MAIDLGDDGNIKAMGVVTLGADLDNSDVRALGIRNARFSLPGQVFVELVEPLSGEEMLAVATVLGTAPQFVSAASQSDTEVLLTLRDIAGAFDTGAFWFAIIRNVGANVSKELIPA